MDAAPAAPLDAQSTGLVMTFAYFHELRPEARLSLWVPWQAAFGMENDKKLVYFVSGHDGIDSGWHGGYGVAHGSDGPKLEVMFNYQGGRHALRTHRLELSGWSTPDLSEIPFFNLAFHALYAMDVGEVLSGCVQSDPRKPQITMRLLCKVIANPPPMAIESAMHRASSHSSSLKDIIRDWGLP